MGGMSFLAFRAQKSSPARRVAHSTKDLPKNFKRNSNPNADFSASLQNAKQYSYEELLVATDNFDPENMIGEGAFGEVFKGRLNDDTLVAIKVLSARSEQGLPEFLKEIEVLSTLDHVNLVKLYGCCAEGQHRILVYGYVKKNSLAQTLLGDPCNKREFTWEVRSRICVGLAEGFAFLHEEGNHPRIVHRDIKPSNVLIDEDYTPKIADFGLARIFPNSKTHINTLVAGTYGYLAPEYIFTGRLSSKADVYSYGVLLLEIVSGSRKTAEEQYLPAKTWKLYKKGKLDELVDETLKGNSFVDDELAGETLKGNSCIDEACRYLKIGLLCTQELPAKRPKMSDVAKMLKGEIDVDKRKIPKPRKLIALLAMASSSCEPRAPWKWSCFCGS